MCWRWGGVLPGRRACSLSNANASVHADANAVVRHESGAPHRSENVNVKGQATSGLRAS
jgi:hypothetical protein